MKNQRFLKIFTCFILLISAASGVLYAQEILETIRLEGRPIAEDVVLTPPQKRSFSVRKKIEYSSGNDIIFFHAGFRYVRRTGYPYTGVLFIGNSSKDKVLTVKSLSLYSPSSPKVHLTPSLPLFKGTRTLKTGPFIVRTEAFEKPLLPMGEKLEELEKVNTRLKNLELESVQNQNDMKILQENKDYGTLCAKAKSLREEIESSFAETAITIDLSQFPALEVVGSKIEIPIEVEIEDDRYVTTVLSETMGIKRYPVLPTPGDWYAGDPHTHTTWSDGTLASSQLVQNAASQDLDWLAITDHSHMTGFTGWAGIHKDNIYDYVSDIELSDDIDNLYVIGAMELGSCNIIPSWSQGHYLVYPDNTLNYLNCTIPSDETGWPRYIEDIMAEAERIGSFGYIAHPDSSPLYGWQGEFSGYSTLRGMEVINGGSYFNYDNTAWAYLRWWDELKKKNRILGHAATDIHYKIGEDIQEVGELVTYVKVLSPTKSTILEGYRKGCSSFGLGAWLDIEVVYGDAAKTMGETLFLPASGLPQVNIKSAGRNYIPVYEGYGALVEIRYLEIDPDGVWRFAEGDVSGKNEWDFVHNNREVQPPVSAYQVIGVDAGNQNIAFTNPVFIERAGYRVDIQSDPPGITIDATADLNGLAGRRTPFYGVYTDSILLTATTTHSGYEFKEWRKNEEFYSSAYTISVSLNSDVTLTAVYEPVQLYSLSMDVVPPTSGSIQVSPSPGPGGTYPAGTTVTLTAVPSSGYIFWQWSVTGMVFTDVMLPHPDEISFSMNMDRYAVATFIPDCAVGIPTAPSGPSPGIVNTGYTYSTGGSTCSNGHSVQYRFDWGDGTYSAWSSSTSASHSWPSAGTYGVKAQARCEINTESVSAWSGSYQVVINTYHSKAERTLPGVYVPGAPVFVSISVTPDEAVQVYAVEDTPPEGWAVSDISDSGQWDGVNKKVKWGPFFESNIRTLTYKATPPEGEEGIKTFAGTASFDGTDVAVGGDNSIQSSRGDINRDGEINISDVILCLRMSIGLPITVNDVEYTSIYPEWLIDRVDMDREDGVNISDVILLLRKAIGSDG